MDELSEVKYMLNRKMGINNYMICVSCMTYNHAKYIVDAMNGFTMQETSFPFVCVIIDDASTDGEQEVIKQYLEQHFDLDDESTVRNEETDDYVLTYAQHKTNKNCFFAVLYLKYNHYSIKKSIDPYIKEWMNVKYVALCEGDDYWTHPKKLQMQYEALESHPECSFCGTGFIIKSNYKVIKDMTIPLEGGKEYMICGIECLGRKWVGQTLTLLFRKVCYDNYIKERGKYNAPKDTYLLYHLFKQGKCIYLGQGMGFYNYNGQGIWSSRTNAEKKAWELNTYRELFTKNDKDIDVYDLYLGFILKNLRCNEIKNNKLKLWYEGARISNSLNGIYLLTRALFSNYKRLFNRVFAYDKKNIKTWAYNSFLLPLERIYYRRRSQYTNTGKIALCCMAKMENEYIRFYVEYYKNLHFDKVFLYDNNDPNGERFDEVIGDYINSHFVEVIDFRGRKAAQLAIYQDCYDKFNKEYDWIAFFDCDEFLTFADETEDIHKFLSQKKFMQYQLMHVNWKVYGDNEMLDNDGRNVIDRFKTPIPNDTVYGLYGVKYVNNHIKSLIRGGLSKVSWKRSWHTHSVQSPYYLCCNPEGVLVDVNSPSQAISHETLYLRHYSTKTIGEWVRNKMQKGRSDRIDEEGMFVLSLDFFFRYNIQTEEKLQYAKKIMRESVNKKE